MIQTIIEACIIPLILAIGGYLVSYFQVKKEQLKTTTKNETVNKYLDMLNSTITNCVLATTQTYVSELKKTNSFTKEAQTQAFTITFQKIKNTLTEESKVYLAEVIADLDEYITNKIEAEVKLFKDEK